MLLINQIFIIPGRPVEVLPVLFFKKPIADGMESAEANPSFSDVFHRGKQKRLSLIGKAFESRKAPAKSIAAEGIEPPTLRV